MVPTYNEARTLHRLVETFERKARGIDLLVVDDASPDGTGALADRMAATRPWLHVLHRSGKDGLGNAYRAGFAWGLERDYAAIGQLDADLSHPPALLPKMLEALWRGADLVLGSRYLAGRRQRRLAAAPPHRQPHRLRRVSARALGLPYSDLSGGFKLWRASALSDDRRRLDALAGLRLPGRDDAAGPPRRAAHRRAALHVPRSHAPASPRWAVDRVRGRAHGRAPAPRRLDSLSASASAVRTGA